MDMNFGRNQEALEHEGFPCAHTCLNFARTFTVEKRTKNLEKTKSNFAITDLNEIKCPESKATVARATLSHLSR